MPGLFSTEGKFYGALSLAADLVIVNVMMLVAMLPVVTGGAALRAATVVITQLLAPQFAHFCGSLRGNGKHQPSGGSLLPR